MELYQILCLIGIPSICASITSVALAKVKKGSEEGKALKLGIQALLRAQIINDYNKWIPKGYAPIYARDNFENIWRQYHALGANGVICILTCIKGLPEIDVTEEE